MDRHELNEMFDGLVPNPQRERELIRQLLQDDTRRKRPMKNWKRVVVGVAAAALLVTAATAAVVPGLSRKLLDYLGIAPEDTQAVELLVPGAMTVDITKEDNGATLHVTQVLRDRTSVMVLAEFTAPEGTSLRLGSTNPKVTYASTGFSGEPWDFAFLDQNGEEIDGDSYAGDWKILEDDDPLDNHLSALFVASNGELFMEKAASLRLPAGSLGYWDLDEDENFKFFEVYSGDWSVEVPLPQRDIGYVQHMDQVIGTLDEAALILKEVYISPMFLELQLGREGGFDFGAPMDDENEAAYSRWLSIGNNVQRITLTTGDGEVIPLEMSSFGGGSIAFEEKWAAHRLSRITDPAKFQGGTLTLEWDFYNSDERGSVTIFLDDLAPVEP
ncbi:MAG: hypothetical protein K2M42_07855 [Oscillospiraceae bacterium]|nr:hypothetical protein [Oscillospiraceae bacterium]